MANYYGSGTGPIWLTKIECTGNESSLAECRSPGWSMQECRHVKDVSIYCSDGNNGKYYFQLPLTNSK